MKGGVGYGRTIGIFRGGGPAVHAGRFAPSSRRCPTQKVHRTGTAPTARLGESAKPAPSTPPLLVADLGDQHLGALIAARRQSFVQRSASKNPGTGSRRRDKTQRLDAFMDGPGKVGITGQNRCANGAQVQPNATPTAAWRDRGDMGPGADLVRLSLPAPRWRAIQPSAVRNSASYMKSSILRDHRSTLWRSAPFSSSTYSPSPWHLAVEPTARRRIWSTG